MKERCQVVEKAKELAITKGLNPDEVNCFREKTCTGTSCAYTKVPNVVLETQTVKFFNKLEKK